MSLGKATCNWCNNPIHVLMARSLFQAHLHECSLDPSTPLWVFREQAETREAPDLTTAQEFAHFPPLEAPPNHQEFLPGVKRVLHAPGAISQVTDKILIQKFLIEHKSAAAITPMRS